MKIDNYIVDINDSLNVAIEKISLNGVRTVFVMNKKKLTGIVSEGDILRALVYKKKLESPVEKIMNKSFLYLKKLDYEKAKKIFIEHQTCVIPVVNKNMVLSNILTLENFLKNYS